MRNKTQLILTLQCFFITMLVSAQTYYVDAVNGRDTNDGSRQLPFKSLAAVVSVANSQTGAGDLVIKVMPGYYLLMDKIPINPIRMFTDTTRFILEALVMPDDPDWSPAKMPVIQSISANNSATFFNHAVGLLVASDRVSIRGLKFLGNANPEVSYYYPITKEDKSLADLEVSQCMFIGDKESARIQGGIWAHGRDNTVDHCIFYECRNAVLLFDNVEGFRISHNIITRSYESAFWFGPNDVKFQFFNNIIANNSHVIVSGGTDNPTYTSPLTGSLITNNDGFVGYWSRSEQRVVNIENPNVRLEAIVNKGLVELEQNTGVTFNKRHLHLTGPAIGGTYGAGLFKLD